MTTGVSIDLEAIENLRALSPDDGDAFLKDIVGIFLDDTPSRIVELKGALAEGDAPKFTRAAHSIKGSSSNLGALAVREAAARLEQVSRNQGLSGLELGIADLEAAFEAAKSALEKIISPS